MVFPNVRLAARVGQNGILWGFISVVLFFVFYLVFGGTFVAITYKGDFTQTAMKSYAQSHPFAGVTMLLFGIGGILLTRYILERIGKQQKK